MEGEQRALSQYLPGDRSRRRPNADLGRDNSAVFASPHMTKSG